MNGSRLLVAALRDPSSVQALDAGGWNALIAAARAELLIGTLANRVHGLDLPPAAARIMDDARHAAEQGRVAALWEAEMARRALAPLDVPVVLLKGTAFVAAGLDAGVGRHIGDLDILVPRAALDAVEAALIAAGWEWVKPDPYDDAYYRRWMHELPPLIHRTRDRMIDVHHTILPLTARPKPLPDRLIAAVEKLPGGLFIPSPVHLVIHAAAHLFADGDLAGGLRNLWDIDRLCREFRDRDARFYLSLIEEAAVHGLAEPVLRALRLTHHLYSTPVPEYHEPLHLELRLRRSDPLFLHRLLGRDGWGRQRRKATEFAYYLRGHALRMPPAMLARHLWTKWHKGRPSY